MKTLLKTLAAGAILAILGATYGLGQGSGVSLITTLANGDLVGITPATNPTVFNAITVQNLAKYVVGATTTPCTASGTSPQTCNGARGVVTTGTLSTAAATSASFTINNSSVTASSEVNCQVDAYSGTISTNGNPITEECVPGSGTITVSIRNINAANALNGTVGIGFTVNN